jgi:hypothetical protein
VPARADAVVAAVAMPERGHSACPDKLVLINKRAYLFTSENRGAFVLQGGDDDVTL